MTDNGSVRLPQVLIMKAPILRGLRILVVEDEPLCAWTYPGFVERRGLGSGYLV
jgi:hypothetical protein